MVFSPPSDNFWTFFRHFSDIFPTFFRHFVDIPFSGLSNDLPVTKLGLVGRACKNPRLLTYNGLRSQKGPTKPKSRTSSTKTISEQFEGAIGSLPCKTRVLRQIAPKSSPERSGKSLSHSFIVVPFLSPTVFSNKCRYPLFAYPV